MPLGAHVTGGGGVLPEGLGNFLAEIKYLRKKLAFLLPWF